jgi:hypothetical protein
MEMENKYFCQKDLCMEQMIISRFIKPLGIYLFKATKEK